MVQLSSSLDISSVTKIHSYIWLHKELFCTMIQNLWWGDWHSYYLACLCNNSICEDWCWSMCIIPHKQLAQTYHTSINKLNKSIYIQSTAYNTRSSKNTNYITWHHPSAKDKNNNFQVTRHTNLRTYLH